MTWPLSQLEVGRGAVVATRYLRRCYLCRGSDGLVDGITSVHDPSRGASRLWPRCSRGVFQRAPSGSPPGGTFVAGIGPSILPNRQPAQTDRRSRPAYHPPIPLGLVPIFGRTPSHSGADRINARGCGGPISRWHVGFVLRTINGAGELRSLRHPFRTGRS